MRDTFDIPVPVPPSTPTDFNGGFLCHWVYWRPNPSDPDPDMPGLKQKVSTYMPLEPEVACLCGSGRPYSTCCRRRRYWYPICPNPRLQGYSFLAPQQAIFSGVDGRAVAKALWNDVRLHDVEATPARSFWVHWGEPAHKSRYGIICFGDIELRERQTLIVTAMSNRRMRTLLGVLRDTGVTLPAPRMSYDRVQVIDKRTGEAALVPPPKKK